MAISLAAYASGILALWVITVVVKQALSPLRTIPGPFLARFTRFWFLYRVWRGHFERDNITLHRKYNSSIVRYGPHHYSVTDPEAINLIYGQSTEFDKSSWYEGWNAPGFKTLFTEPSVKVHAQLRRKFQSTYSMSSMITYEAFVDHCIDILCQRFEEIAKCDGNADMFQWMLCYAADTVSMITFSKRMGFLNAGEDVDDFFKTLHGNILYNSLMGIYSELHPPVYNAIAWLSRLKLMGGTSRMLLARLISSSISEKRKERASQDKPDAPRSEFDENAPKDFLSKFLDSNEQDSTRFTERDIQVGLIGNVIAGSDTTASALSATFYCLLKNPSALAKLRDEISSHIHSGTLSSPPTFKEAHNLTYLQAVIQEAMRMYPAVGLPLQRVVPPGGVQICGRLFPAGTVVGVNPWVMHADTSLFGDDAASFRPERWLEADKERLTVMQKYWMPFGLGSRTCIGKNISMLEMTKVVPELVKRFDFELGDVLRGDGESIELVNHWFVLPAFFPVKINLRK